MKLQKIGKICKKKLQMILITDEAKQQQYIQSGRATYMLEGMPRMYVGGLKTVFDIMPKQEDDMMIEEKNANVMSVSMEDTVTDEDPVQDEGISISYLGKNLMPLIMPDGEVLFFDRDYFAPLTATERVELYARKTHGGQRYLMVKQGLLAKIEVMPEERDEKMEELIRRIGK